MRNGARGLRPGRSLPQLLAKRRGVRNLPGTPALTVETILGWIDAHKLATGRWPTVYAGPVAGQPGETWLGVNSALDCGARGLPGGNSLAKLLRERFGVVNRYRGGRPKRSDPYG